MTDAERFIQFCESEFGATVMDREAAYVKQHVAPEDRILDVGCGIGSLEERFTSYVILGVDQSDAMVRAARERTATQLLRGDAHALPIAPGTVDSVVFVTTLSFISDLDKSTLRRLIISRREQRRSHTPLI